ncbi:MAG: hypothetical protein E2592_01185 [Methylobacillus sp.]|nr:hypothetical protein [Methylobacillus sp.]
MKAGIIMHLNHPDRTVVRSRLLIMLALCCLAFSTACKAQDLIIKREVFRDPSNSLDIHAVERQQFEPAKKLLTAGYTPDTHWLRIVVGPSSPQPLELRIRPTYLDEVTLYQPDPDHPGQWLARTTGDTYPFEERDVLYPTAFGFLIQGQPESTVYYLKLKTTSTSILYAEVLTPQDSRLKDLRRSALIVMYLSLMLWLTFWAANDFISTRHRLTGLFVLYQLTHIAYVLSVLGYLAPFVHAPLNDKLTSLLVISVAFISILLHYSLLVIYKPSRIGMRALLALSFFYPFLLFLLCTGHAQAALQINAYIILAGAILFLTLPYTARQDSTPSRKTLQLIYALQTLSIGSSMMPIVGWIATDEWNLNSGLAYSLVSGLLMYIILQQRSAALRQEAEKTRLALQLAQQELAFEREKRDELGHFMAMITHELKTPLAVIRLALDAMQMTGPLKKHVEHSINDISDMIDRCAQINRIEDQSIQVNVESCDTGRILTALISEYGCAARVDLRIGAAAVINTDQLMLRLILRNLLENALKYAPAGSPILIEVNTQPHADGRNSISICIENSVETPPDISRLFDKYYRGPGSRKQTGFGLGLYLSRALALLLKGRLDASLHGDRIRLCLWLPH